LRVVVLAFGLLFGVSPPAGGQLTSALISNSGSHTFTDSLGFDHDVQVRAVTNTRTGGLDYFLLALPTVGTIPYPVKVYVNPYAVFPSPPSANPADAAWTSQIREPGPRYDMSLPRQFKTMRCSSASGDCEIAVEGPVDLSDLITLADVFYEGEDNRNADQDLLDGYAVAIAFGRHYAGRGMASVVYGIQNTLEALQGLPEIDRNRIGMLGRSQGGQLAIHSLAIPDRPLSIAAVVTDGAWVSGRTMRAYYIDQLPRVQPSSLLRQSLDFAIPNLERLFRSFGPNPDSSLWQPITAGTVAERFHTPILLLHGTDDLMVPSSESAGFVELLWARGKTANRWTYENGPPPFGSRTVVEGGHGIGDARSPVKKKILARMFFLKHMPPDIPAIRVRHPQEIDLVAMISTFRDTLAVRPRDTQNTFDLVDLLRNARILFESSDPRIPSGPASAAVTAAIRVVIGR
jgi:dienelactone hydrolase